MLMESVAFACKHKFRLEDQGRALPSLEISSKDLFSAQNSVWANECVRENPMWCVNTYRRFWTSTSAWFEFLPSEYENFQFLTQLKVDEFPDRPFEPISDEEIRRVFQIYTLFWVLINFIVFFIGSWQQYVQFFFNLEASWSPLY